MTWREFGQLALAEMRATFDRYFLLTTVNVVGQTFVLVTLLVAVGLALVGVKGNINAVLSLAIGGIVTYEIGKRLFRRCVRLGKFSWTERFGLIIK